MDFHIVACRTRSRGPCTLAEAFAWPRTEIEMVRQVLEMERRLRALLANGVVSSSDYSGYGSDTEIMHQLSAAMDSLQWPAPEHVPRFTCSRSCDCAPLPQKALLSLAKVVRVAMPVRA